MELHILRIVDRTHEVRTLLRKSYEGLDYDANGADDVCHWARGTLVMPTQTQETLVSSPSSAPPPALTAAQQPILEVVYGLLELSPHPFLVSISHAAHQPQRSFQIVALVACRAPQLQVAATSLRTAAAKTSSNLWCLDNEPNAQCLQNFFSEWQYALRGCGVSFRSASIASQATSLGSSSAGVVKGVTLPSIRPIFNPDPLLKVPDDDVPLSVLMMSFPYETIRIIQSLLLMDESLVIVDRTRGGASAAVVSLLSLMAPFRCQHRVRTFIPPTAAAAALQSTATNGSKQVFFGTHSSAVPSLMMVNLTTLPRSAWIADCRTGAIGRLAHRAEGIVATTLPLLPPIEKFKETYRRYVSKEARQLHHARASPWSHVAPFPPSVHKDVFGSLLESMVGVVGCYRKGLEQQTQCVNAHRTVAGSLGSAELWSQRFAERLSKSDTWKALEEELLCVERRSDQLIVAVLRGTVPIDGPFQLTPSPLSASIGDTSVLSGVVAFVQRCVRKYEDLYAKEFTQSGRPPKDNSAAKIQQIKSFFGKAISQMSTPSVIDIPSGAPPFMQCEHTFVSSGPPQLAASSEKLCGSIKSLRLPIDMLHYFDAYHQSIAPIGASSNFGSQLPAPLCTKSDPPVVVANAEATQSKHVDPMTTPPTSPSQPSAAAVVAVSATPTSAAPTVPSATPTSAVPTAPSAAIMDTLFGDLVLSSAASQSRQTAGGTGSTEGVERQLSLSQFFTTAAPPKGSEASCPPGGATAAKQWSAEDFFGA